MSRANHDASPSELIDARIAELGDWRGARGAALDEDAFKGLVTAAAAHNERE